MGAFQTMTDHLTRLEHESVFIIREAYKDKKSEALLWSMGKDSTVLLHLVRKSFSWACADSTRAHRHQLTRFEMITWRDHVRER